MCKEILLAMSSQELKRAEVMRDVTHKSLSQKEAAQQLGRSVRQIKRLVKEFRLSGARGLISKKRGKQSNRGFSKAFRNKVIVIVKKQYADFGPSFACEKLSERDKLHVNKETLRQWMTAEGIWKTKRRGDARIHQSRERRECKGELIQIDGSEHNWFEGRAPRCSLLVFIDDATSELMYLQFVPAETTNAYFEAVRFYCLAHGKPIAWYSDKHSVFRVNKENILDDSRGETHFQRAMNKLDIQLICAHSSQAKGRVERANKTLQDRLVKEMRLHEISDMESGNAYLPKFMKQHNEKFSVRAKNQDDVHRSLGLSEKCLDKILCQHYTRKLSKNLECSLNNVIYKIQTQGKGYILRYAHVTLCAKKGEVIEISYKGNSLNFEKFDKAKKATLIATRKEVSAMLAKKKSEHIRVGQAKASHPWRGKFRAKEEDIKSCLPTRSNAPTGGKDSLPPLGPGLVDKQLPHFLG